MSREEYPLFETGAEVSEILSKAAAAPTHDDVAAAAASVPRYAYNLLDNSDFTNPVNQRGVTSGTVSAWTHFIDRWKVTDADMVCSLSANGMQLEANGAAKITQALQITDSDTGENFTLAFGLSDGSVILASGECPADTAWQTFATASNDKCEIYISRAEGNLLRCDILPKVDITLTWAALYEGEYTAENLPKYMPKGYAAEVAICRDYYRKIKLACPPIIASTATRYYIVPFGSPMKKTPSISIISGAEKKTWSDTGATFAYSTANEQYARLSAAASITVDYSVWAEIEIAASADL